MAKKESIDWSDFSEESILDDVEDVGTLEEEEVVKDEAEEEEKVEKEKVEKEPEKKKEDKKKDIKKQVKVSEEKEEVNKPVEEEEIEESQEDKSSEVDPQTFFEEVHKITGQEVDVEYGDVDPLTPEGIALREKAVREAAVQNFAEELETNYPVAFKALQHALNGGDISELFKVANTRDYTKVELGDEDTALAKEILKEYYQERGIKNQNRIAKLIETAEDSEEGLITEAKGALEELKEEQLEKENELIERQKQQKLEQKKKDQLLISAVDEVIESGKLDTFKLAGPKESSEFRSYVLKSISRAPDGSYQFITPIDAKNLDKILKNKFFEFKGGDINKLITIKSTTEAAKKLRLKFQSEEQKKKSTSEEGSKSVGFDDFLAN